MTQIQELGEFRLIDALTECIELQNESTKIGVGDDCAVMNYGDKDVVATTDLLLEGIHFDLTYTPLKHLGYKAAMVNISDVCAMNARPTQMLVSIGISQRFSVEQIEEIYRLASILLVNVLVSVWLVATHQLRSQGLRSVSRVLVKSKKTVPYFAVVLKRPTLFVLQAISVLPTWGSNFSNVKNVFSRADKTRVSNPILLVKNTSSSVNSSQKRVSIQSNISVRKTLCQLP